ncbi:MULTISPECIES: LysR family transcriptional regulator substrate-binding protein [Micrococcaceae]|uniref:LysR family transcriptional regulator substrate-binding protein n=1 Tax=unclassified Kocuria TaxID=2649579 RepID=UPI00101116EA|nr:MULTISPECIES: LysR family transcriptional regulator substrate-binding protein [unclassified Kocuria]
MSDSPSENSPHHDDAPRTPAPTGRQEPIGPPSEGLTVGFVPGVMPGKWFARWDERFGRSTPLERLALEEGTGLRSLTSADAHMVLVRTEAEPECLDKTRFHAVHLYEEKPVVLLPADHVLTIFDEVPLEELAEEFMLQEPENIPEWAAVSNENRNANPRKLPSMRDTGDAVELVAAGLGLLIVPMSVARHHHRKDLTYRIVEDMPRRSVALVWTKDVDGSRSDEDESVLQEFVGITRGRKASSSRGASGAKADQQVTGRTTKRPAPVRRKPGRASSSGGANSSKARSAKNPRSKSRGKKK